jgi:hypothetical protein
MAHYIFNVRGSDAKLRATEWLCARMWAVDAAEPHRNALAAGDLVLVYLGAPASTFIGRAELASAVHDWTPADAQASARPSAGGVILVDVEEWDPPVSMTAVLAEIDRSEGARAEFEHGVVRITATEYETALAVAARRAAGAGAGAG